MTVGLASAFANGMLDTIEGTAYSPGHTSTFAKLHTGDPGTGSANASQHTTRQEVTAAEWAAASGGSKTAGSSPAVWTIASLTAPTTESISHLSFWTDVSAGSLIFTVAVTTPKSVSNGDTLTLTSVSVAITPIAA